METQAATKADVADVKAELKADIGGVKATLRVHNWMLGTLMVINLAILGKLLYLH